MPGGKRTDRVSRRDLEVLEFVARFGVVSRAVVSGWAGTRRTVTIVRESRLVRAGLLESRSGPGDLGPVVWATLDGLRSVGRLDLRPPRFSLGSVVHDCEVARVGARFEVFGDEVLSEREIAARARDVGRGFLAAVLPGGRFHRADLARRQAGGWEVVEVELAVKGSRRLDELLRAWRRAVGEGLVSGVLYLCSAPVLPVLERAVDRTRTQGVIRVEGV